MSHLNRIIQTDLSTFSLCFLPPPPPPIDIRFSFNKQAVFTQKDVEQIIASFHSLIYHPSQKFIKKYSPKRTLQIAITKGFHQSSKIEESKQTEHFNCKIIVDDSGSLANTPTLHVYLNHNKCSVFRITEMNSDSYL
jgi:hypothetical protein